MYPKPTPEALWQGLPQTDSFVLGHRGILLARGFPAERWLAFCKGTSRTRRVAHLDFRNTGKPISIGKPISFTVWFRNVSHLFGLGISINPSRETEYTTQMAN